MWYIYYNWWANINWLLLAKVHRLHYASLCLQFCGFGQMSDDMYPLCSIIPNGFPALKISWFLPFILSPLSWNPSNHFLLFTVSIVVLSSECHGVGIIQHGAFLESFLSLSSMHLRFLHILWLGSSFLFITEWYSIVWMYHSFLTIHLLKCLSWLLPYFGNYDESCCKHLCVGFCVDLSFGLVSQDLRCRWSLGT